MWCKKCVIQLTGNQQYHMNDLSGTEQCHWVPAKCCVKMPITTEKKTIDIIMNDLSGIDKTFIGFLAKCDVKNCLLQLNRKPTIL